MKKEKKSLGDKFQRKLQGAADVVKDAVDDIDLPEVKVPKKVQKAVLDVSENIQDAAGTVKAKVSEVDLPDINVPNKVKDLLNKDDDESMLAPEEVDGAKVLSTNSALKLVYYLMAVNGEVYHSEEEKFNSLGKELDPNFTDNREKIVKTCQTHLGGAEDREEYYVGVRKGVAAAIISSKPTIDSFITPKLLVWNLLTIAYSDDNYDELETKLIRYIVKKLKVNETEFLEMESSFLTLMDIQKETEWIKTTDRPYKTIEAVLNELADRKEVILESVNDLITL